MNPETILLSFIGLRSLQHISERYLAYLNKNYYQDQTRLSKAAEVLKINSDDLEKTKSYSTDKYKFGAVSSWITLPIVLLFIYFGGFTYLEKFSMNINPWPNNEIVTGLLFIVGGLIPSVRFLIYFLAGESSGHIQSLILAARSPADSPGGACSSNSKGSRQSAKYTDCQVLYKTGPVFWLHT